MIDTTTRGGLTLADAPQVGQYWEGQGGFYAGIIPDYVGTQPRFLIFAADEAIDVEWGGLGSDDGGALDTDNGSPNTQSLTECRHGKDPHEAAQYASSYEKDGHRDFYLPSRRELDVAFQTIPDKFDPSDWYWSSTQQSRLGAYGRDFGDQSVPVPSLPKHIKGRARPARSIPVAEEGTA
ncbi:hypothetical protein [Trinickia sp.]|uniref:hypothetical protein n=1 Tax=Trinickia sp. TaxID=2571163 RepID=UPI003F80962D